MLKRWSQFTHDLCNVSVKLVIVLIVLAISLMPPQYKPTQAMLSSAHIAQALQCVQVEIVKDTTHPGLAATALTRISSPQNPYANITYKLVVTFLVHYDTDACLGALIDNNISRYLVISIKCGGETFFPYNYTFTKKHINDNKPNPYFYGTAVGKVVTVFTCQCARYNNFFKPRTLPVMVHLFVKAVAVYHDRNNTLHERKDSTYMDLNNGLTHLPPCNCNLYWKISADTPPDGVQW